MPLYRLLFVLLLFPAFGYSQNLYTLSGHVIDENNKTVDAGEAALLRRGDSALVKTAVISQGEFIMDTTKSGNYLLRILANGFEHQLINVRVDESKLVPIRLVRRKN